MMPSQYSDPMTCRALDCPMSEDQAINQRSTGAIGRAGSAGRGFRSAGVWLLLPLVIYAAGLTRNLTQPWVGMHDWNGAFFSQLARNVLRYPLAVHRGMPMIAVGAKVPAPEERSIYATHPPGLVWLLAGMFSLFGESEAVARMMAVAASLAALVLFLRLADRAYGRGVAVVSGLIYAVMPMSVYFGRMVDHEAICLCCMLGAVTGWVAGSDRSAPRRTRLAGGAGWACALTIGCWVDWSVVLFAGVFGLDLILRAAGRTGPMRRTDWIRISAALGLSLGVVMTVVGFVVHAGLAGRWGDGVTIFISRAGASAMEGAPPERAPTGGAWTHTIDNLTWPVVVLAAWGLVTTGRRRTSGGGQRSTATGGHDPRAGAGLWMIGLTGFLWLLIFWRQYELHNYWLFYVGPMMAILAARGLVDVRRRFGVFGRRAAYGGAGLLLAGTLLVELMGVDEYFQRVSNDLVLEVDDWRRIRRLTHDGDRVLLFRNPVREERRGDYRLRNVVPPQLAYYLDRAFAVEEDFSRVRAREKGFAMFILSKSDAVRNGEALSVLRRAYEERPLNMEVVFDLRRRRAPHALTDGGREM